MECIQNEEDEADGNDTAQHQGVATLAQVNPLHQTVDHREPVWGWLGKRQPHIKCSWISVLGMALLVDRCWAGIS